MKTKHVLIALVGIAILAFIASKVLFTKPRVTAEPWSPPAPSMPEHSKADYSPSSIARDQCRKLTNALREFHAKRGHRPLPEGSPSDEKHAFAIDAAMLDALSGKDNAGVDYLKAAGLTTLVPPDRFRAAFDFNDDGNVPDPSSPETNITQDILVWSTGEDGKPETWADNAFAWLKP
jgi:hypothetical protein